MSELLFPGGIVRIDPERVWAELQRWLEADMSRRCGVHRDSLGYCCRLSWDYTDPDTERESTAITAARSQLGIADAVANALQAVLGQTSENPR